MKKTFLFLIYAFMGASAFIQGTAVASDDEIDIVTLSPKSAAALKKAQEQVEMVIIKPLSQEAAKRSGRKRKANDTEKETADTSGDVARRDNDRFKNYKRLKRFNGVEADEKNESAESIAENNTLAAAGQGFDIPSLSKKKGKAYWRRILHKNSYVRPDDGDGRNYGSAAAALDVEGESSQKIGQPQKKSRLLKYYIKNGIVDRAKLCGLVGINRRVLAIHIYNLRQKGVLSQEYSQKLYDDYAWSNIVAQKIKEKVPLTDILEYCDFNAEGIQAQKLRLNRMISTLYERKKLTHEETLYLKSKKTVIAGKGNTKLKILDFLEERSQREPSKTTKDLADEFNASNFKAVRAITSSTFREHVSDMLDSGHKYYDRMKAFKDFYESCKGSSRFAEGHQARLGK